MENPNALPAARALYLRALSRATYAPTAARYVRAIGALAARARRYALAYVAYGPAYSGRPALNARRYATAARRARAATYA